jgi:DNA-binding SARP family transcriptional activator
MTIAPATRSTMTQPPPPLHMNPISGQLVRSIIADPLSLRESRALTRWDHLERSWCARSPLPVRNQSDRSTVINFEVLGRVTAWQDDWVADLSPQQQLLLARLVIARGAPVTRAHLTVTLWDDEERSPDGALKRVVSELRAQLRSAPSAQAGDPLPSSGDTYRLPLEDQQADVLRFHSKITEARRSTGQETTRLMREALREWGTNATGLYGGYPLSGLHGHWSDSTRAKLRTEHRNARFHCLQQDMYERQYHRLIWECDQLADDADALNDEAFIELWMLATYWAGDRPRAAQVFRTATDSAMRHLGSPLSGRLRRLAELIQNEDPQLGAQDDPLFLDTASPIRTNEDRKSMNEHGIVFNNSDNAKVGVQAGEVSDVTINMESTAVPADDSAEVCDEQEA